MTLLMRDNKMREEGREEGRENEIFLSVQEGDYNPKRGAEKLGITEDEFIKRMNAAGYKIYQNKIREESVLPLQMRECGFFFSCILLLICIFLY